MGPRRRLERVLAVGVAAAVLAVATAGAAGAAVAAAGTVGVEGVGLRLELSTHDDGRPVLAVDQHAKLRVTLANSAETARTVRVYTVAVTERNGAFALGARDSAEWLPLDAEDIRLAPNERTTVSAPVQGHRVPADAAYAAAVVESGSGSEVVTRAASVFHVRGQDAAAGLDGLVTLAVLLMGAVLLGHLLRVRGRVEGFLARESVAAS